MDQGAEVSVAEAASTLGVSTETVRARIRRGELGARLERRGSRFAYRVDRSDVARAAATIYSDAGTPLSGRGATQVSGRPRGIADAVSVQQVVMDLLQEADAARASVNQHLLAALEASEKADEKRREVIAALQGVVRALVVPDAPADH